MTREIDSNLRNAISDPVIHPVYLIELMYDDAPLRLHSGTRNITFQGNNYRGVGQFGSISSSAEVSDQATTFIDLTLSGIQASDIGLQLNQYYQGRTGTVWLGLRDLSDNSLITPTIIFKGVMDNSRITVSDKIGSISVRLNSPLVRWDKPNIKRYTEADQQEDFPNDKGFEFVPLLREQRGLIARWG